MVDIEKRQQIRLSVVACPFFLPAPAAMTSTWVSEFKERPEPSYHSVYGLPHPHFVDSPIYFHLTFKAVSRNFIWASPRDQLSANHFLDARRDSYSPFCRMPPAVFLAEIVLNHRLLSAPRPSSRCLITKCRKIATSISTAPLSYMSKLPIGARLHFFGAAPLP